MQELGGDSFSSIKIHNVLKKKSLTNKGHDTLSQVKNPLNGDSIQVPSIVASIQQVLNK